MFSFSKINFVKGTVLKWCHLLWEEGDLPKCDVSPLSPLSKIGYKGEGGVQNLKEWLISFIDGPKLIISKKYFLWNRNFFFQNKYFTIAHSSGLKYDGLLASRWSSPTTPWKTSGIFGLGRFTQFNMELTTNGSALACGKK